MNTRQYMRYIQYMLYKQYIPIQYNTCITYNTYNIYNTYQYKSIHAIQVNTIFSSILVQYIQIHTNTIEYMHYTYQYKNTNKYGKLRFNTNKRVLCLYWNPNTILKFQYRQYRHEVPVMKNLLLLASYAQSVAMGNPSWYNGNCHAFSKSFTRPKRFHSFFT